jgi:hypothetical protein
MAFDTLHSLRNAKRLPPFKLRTLAALLDLGACANAAFDHKDYCRRELRMTLRLLRETGIGPSLVEYLRRLRTLESKRPFPGGGYRRFQEVRWYRESVVRLSLAMVALTANDNQSLATVLEATRRDPDLDLLFRTAMQCQIIDDVLDYSKDVSAGLPSFLTACESLPLARELTGLTAHSYSADPKVSRTGAFPLRLALRLVSICTKLVLILGCRRSAGLFNPANPLHRRKVKAAESRATALGGEGFAD